jgi:hypothetical protein
MKKNIGSLDRLLRLCLGLGLCLLVLLSSVSLGLKILIILLALFTIFEALVGWCGLYALIGKNTCPIQYEKK